MLYESDGRITTESARALKELAPLAPWGCIELLGPIEQRGGDSFRLLWMGQEITMDLLPLERPQVVRVVAEGDSPTFCRPPWPYGRATRTPGVKYLKARHNQRIVAGLFPERAGLSMQDIPWAKPSFRQELKPRPSEKSGFWPQSSLQQQASESWDGFLLDVRGIVLVPDGAGSHCRELHN
ncbi:unnamed protein product [Durusdinium trenchii]|uniref:Uncharacterized protein n=1 Tax=Durusdinium trenchii TaxID=1381693 RepID=A0ABP0RA57_9DINO